jgi:pimeloyl-ACP methyl ester carboxylesterase
MTGRRRLARMAICSALTASAAAGVFGADAPGRYASVNGLKMYYEVHGVGPPLLLLHGAFLTVESWGRLVPELARSRQVIAVELQGHGHTADVDRPLSFTQMAEDVAALLREIKVERTDVYGYSMGGTVALALAARHPGLVRKLIVQGSTYNKDGWEPEAFKQFSALPPDFAPGPLKDPYDKVAPDPKRWPVLVAKVKEMEITFEGLPDRDLKAITAETLIIMGDREGLRPEQAVAMYRLIPKAQLAILPGADHFLLFTRPDVVLGLVTTFLNSPDTAKSGS